ncbi:MAG: phage terminase large subunit family protein [Hyphomicrobiaceae bacterium]
MAPRAEPQSPAAKRRRCGWQLGLALPPRLTVSQWADQRRIIAPGTGPEPGRWRTDRTPYLREPMDSVSDPDNEITVLHMSSQVGKTEVMINVAGYFVDADPWPQLLVMPTLELADSFSVSRFQKTVDHSPHLLERIGKSTERDSGNTIREKQYPGGDIVFSGANSPASLASRPRRVALLDEVDKYKAHIGSDGDPIGQAIQRTQNFWNRKIVIASTPTIEGQSEIDSWFKRSDQRHFHVPCPDCGEYQPLEWEMVEWPGRDTKEAKLGDATYTCSHCGSCWNQRSLSLSVRAGKWVAHNPGAPIRGYHIWAIYSPWVTMAKLAQEWADARGNEAKEQAFVNLKLGRVYTQSKSSTTTVAMLMARREDYGPTRIPASVLCVTAFCDIQADRIEVQYLGWGIDDEKWVLDYQVLWGDVSAPATWQALDEQLLSREFPHPLGGALPIEAIGIDAGNWSQIVLEFVRKNRQAFRPFYAVKGVAGQGKPLWRESDMKYRAGAKLWLSGVDDGKTILMQELAAGPNDADPAASYRIHFPAHLDEGYFKQLVESERLRIEIKAGRPVRKWLPVSGRRNEALDTFVGAVAVRHALSINYEQRLTQRRGEQRTITGSDLGSLFK